MGTAKTRKRVDAASAGAIIRQVFGASRDFYTPEEAAALLGWSRSEARRVTEEGTVEVTPDSSGRIAWREIALAVSVRYPQADIESSLGPAMAPVIPESVRLADLRLRIPRYQIVMLEKRAGRERISIDEFVAQHLRDLASAG